MVDLKAIIQNLPSAIIVVNRDRRVLLSNWVAQEFSGLSECQIVNKRGGDILGCRHADENELGCGFSTHCLLCDAKRAVEKAFEEKSQVKPFETEMEIRGIGPRFFDQLPCGDRQCIALSAQRLPASRVRGLLS